MLPLAWLPRAAWVLPLATWVLPLAAWVLPLATWVLPVAALLLLSAWLPEGEGARTYFRFSHGPSTTFGGGIILGGRGTPQPPGACIFVGFIAEMATSVESGVAPPAVSRLTSPLLVEWAEGKPLVEEGVTLAEGGR